VLAAFLWTVSNKRLLEPVVVEGADLDVDADGIPVLLVRYRHPFWTQPTALRRRLDRQPASGAPEPGESLALWLADWIANFDVAEPLGTGHDDRPLSSDGYYWWGDGIGPEQMRGPGGPRGAGSEPPPSLDE